MIDINYCDETDSYSISYGCCAHCGNPLNSEDQYFCSDECADAPYPDLD